VCGFLGEVGDVDGLAAGAIELLRDGDRWAAASRAARERATEFDTAKVVGRYEEVYEAVVAR